MSIGNNTGAKFHLVVAIVRGLPDTTGQSSGVSVGATKPSIGGNPHAVYTVLVRVG